MAHRRNRKDHKFFGSRVCIEQGTEEKNTTSKYFRGMSDFSIHCAAMEIPQFLVEDTDVV